MSYASHRLYSSFDNNKVSSHELRNDIKEKLNSFVTTNIKNFLYDLSKKCGFKAIQLKNEYEETLTEQIKSLLQQAQNKRMLSAKIQDYYERALRDLKKKGYENGIINNEKTTKMLKHNLEQIQYLNSRVEYLEKKAQRLQKHLKEIRNGHTLDNFICNIQKSGNLHFVSSASGLKHYIDNVKGYIDESGFSIYHGKNKKMTYYWNLIDMPVKIIGNIEQCFSFLYKNSNQIFCSKDKVKTTSWVNSLVEGFLCYHFDLKGVAVNTKLDSSLIVNKKKNPDLLTVHLKPEDEFTRVNINDDIEHQLKDNEILDIGKIKQEMEDARKVNKSTDISDETLKEEEKEKDKEKDKEKIEMQMEMEEDIL